MLDGREGDWKGKGNRFKRVLASYSKREFYIKHLICYYYLDT